MIEFVWLITRTIQKRVKISGVPGVPRKIPRYQFLYNFCITVTPPTGVDSGSTGSMSWMNFIRQSRRDVEFM